MKGVAFTEERLNQWLDEDGIVYAQPKRDEIRCIVDVHYSTPSVNFTSASGKPLYNLGRHTKTFLALAKEFGVFKFDCGVMINDSFDITKRVVRSSKEHYDTTGNEVVPLYDKKPTKKLPTGVLYFEGLLETKFWIYDLPEITSSFNERLNLMDSISISNYKLQVPSTDIVGSTLGINELYDKYIELGLEGLMIKREDFQYVYGRSSNWMKMKPTKEKDGVITGFTSGQGKFEGLIGSVVVDFGDGTGTSVSGMADDTRKAITAYPQEYIGQVLRVPYMMRDSQGGYRHPRWGGLHEDKVASDVYNAPNED